MICTLKVNKLIRIYLDCLILHKSSMTPLNKTIIMILTLWYQKMNKNKKKMLYKTGMLHGSTLFSIPGPLQSYSVITSLN